MPERPCKKSFPRRLQSRDKSSKPLLCGAVVGAARQSPAVPRPAIPPAVLGQPSLSFRAVTGAAAWSPAGRPALVCGLEAAGPCWGNPLSIRGTDAQSTPLPA